MHSLLSCVIETGRLSRTEHSPAMCKSHQTSRHEYVVAIAEQHHSTRINFYAASSGQLFHLSLKVAQYSRDNTFANLTVPSHTMSSESCARFTGTEFTANIFYRQKTPQHFHVSTF
jgi:hypothetical protein